MRSIRRRLLIPLVGLYAVGWLATAVYAYHQTKHEVRELFDEELILIGNTLHALIKHEILENEQPLLPLEYHPHLTEMQHTIAFQIVRDGKVISSSGELSHDLNPPPGLATITASGTQWRVFTMLDKKADLRIHILEPLRIRHELSDSITFSLVMPLLIVMPGLLLLSWLIIGDALRPLRRVSRMVETRSPQDLSPIDSHDVPGEIQTLTNAINRLLARLDNALARERRFTADAAHELRTPIAALKAQAGVASRARNANERRNALQQIEMGVDRSSRLIEQMLTLARLEPESNESLKMRPLRLCPLIKSCIAALYPAALEKGIDLGLQHCGCHQTRLLGNEMALNILLCNIIGNAIRYTPANGRIDIRAELGEDRIILEVADNGPGIPAAQRQRVLERFYRAEEHRAIQGSGLGLSIVARIADLHRARIALSDTSPEGGLTFRVLFSPYPADRDKQEDNHQTVTPEISPPQGGEQKKARPGRGRPESAIRRG